MGSNLVKNILINASKFKNIKIMINIYIQNIPATCRAVKPITAFIW